MAEPTVGALFQDPNFLQLLAGIGTRLGGPGSAGEILGIPTSQFLAARESQKVGAKIAAQPQQAITNYNQLNERLGDFSPEGTPGPTSIKAKPGGGYVIEGNLHPALLDVRDPQAGVDDLISPDLSPNLNAYPQRPAPTMSLGGEATPSQVQDLIEYPYAPTGTAPTATPTAAEPATPTTPTAAPMQRFAQGGQIPPPPFPLSTATPKEGTQKNYGTGGIGPQSLPPSTQQGVPRYTAAATITPEDLRGLNPAQVNQLIGHSLNASQLEAQVAGLMGRDIGNERRNVLMQTLAAQKERETAGASYSAAKLKAAETIANSNLLPDQQEALFKRLDSATTLADARNELLNAAKLPARIISGEERDAYARQMLGGRTYGQATPSEQADINRRILEEKANWQIQATDQGLFRINQKNGDVFPIIGPTGTSAPAPGSAATPPPSGAGAAPGVLGASSSDLARIRTATVEMGRKYLPNTQNLTDDAVADLVAKNFGFVQSKMTPAEHKAMMGERVGMTDIPPVAPASPGTSAVPGTTAPAKPLTYEQLSPFAKEVSSPNYAAQPFGATKPTEFQLKSQGFGSIALQSHEVVGDLEKNLKEFGNDYWLNTRAMLSQLGPAETLGLVGIVAGAGAGVGRVAGPVWSAIGGGAGAILGLGARIAAPALNFMNTPTQQAYLQAKLNFMLAHLRRDSGSSISVGEFISEDKAYFPGPGDSPEVMAQKTRAREAVIRGMQTEAGRPLRPPDVVPFPIPPKVAQPEVVAPASSVAPVTPAETLRRALGGPVRAPVAPAPPPQTLPVKPQSQLQNAPNLKPTASLPIEHIPYLQAMKGMPSKDIVSGLADDYLSEVGPKTLTQQSSYFGPAQNAAIRARIKKLGIEDTISMMA